MVSFKGVKEIILGLVQGLTEFLPVSSSGHLSLFQYILGKGGISLPVLLHFGTLLSIFFFFHKDIKKILVSLIRPKDKELKNYRYLALFILIGTLPVLIVGPFLIERVKSVWNNIHLLGISFIITGFWLFLSEYFSKKGKGLSFKNGLLIGLAQVFALFPGISRSGMTIGAGLLCGLKKEEAFRFSFLLSIPALLGAFFLEVKEIDFSLASLSGMLTAFIVGLFSLYLLKKIVLQRKLWLFSIYTFILGITLIIYK